MIDLINFKKIRNSMMLFLIFFIYFNTIFAQGLNHNWLLGYYPFQYPKARITFDLVSYDTLSEFRKIPFLGGTQGNISDANGNLLMSSNGYFIANATGDTMINGSGINPNSFTSAWSNGLPFPNANFFLPFPSDTDKYILFHQTGDYNNPPLNTSSAIYYSVIDISLSNGLGEVISKNNIALNGLFGTGMSACKHGNGRDWWIIAISDSGSSAYKFLLTPDSVFYIGNQNLQVPAYEGWAGQPTFSPNGEKFAYIHADPYLPSHYITNMRLFDFDRCDGTFSNPLVQNLPDSTLAFGTAFSADSKQLYVASVWNIYQMSVDSSMTNPALLNVAPSDSFADPAPPFYTNFNLGYLAPNGKIYFNTGNSTRYLHEIIYPDSIGLSCSVQQHSVEIPCLHGQAAPNHPNYYLGRLVGSPCDSLTSINDLSEHNFRFSISPNPTNGNFKIIYLLPQNKSGTLEVFDINGRTVFKQSLPQWSTLQYISLPKLSSGVYNCAITSGNERVNKKIIVFDE